MDIQLFQQPAIIEQAPFGAYPAAGAGITTTAGLFRPVSTPYPNRTQQRESQPFATFGVITTPRTIESEDFGCLITRPRGHMSHVRTHVHIHGIGGLWPDEDRLMAWLSAGKYQGMPMNVIAPLADKIMPDQETLGSVGDALRLLRYLRQFPPEVRRMLRESIGENIKPIWWHRFLFRRDPETRRLRPDMERNVEEILAAAAYLVAPLRHALDHVGAEAGSRTISGKSQGVAMTMALVREYMPHVFSRAVNTCASYIHTANMPALRDPKITVHSIIGASDPVMPAAEISLAQARRDMQAGFGPKGHVQIVPGKHDITGHLAQAAQVSICAAHRAHEHEQRSDEIRRRVARDSATSREAHRPQRTPGPVRPGSAYAA